MSQIPFTVYDFFGYLAAGFLLSATVDFVTGEHWFLQDSLATPYILFWVIVAYIVGHINANLASWVLERKVVGGVLGKPERILLGESTAGPVRKSVFPGYFTPLHKDTCDRILSNAAARGVTARGEALFHHARQVVKRDEETWSRLDMFLAQYGFCRNISFALFVAALILAAASVHSGGKHMGLVGFALAGAIGMLYRYLKFYRHYSAEMFTTYAELRNNGQERQD
jgi:hypothetical protein